MSAILTPDEQGRLSWGNGVVTMTFITSADSPVRMIGLRGRGMTGPDDASDGPAPAGLASAGTTTSAAACRDVSSILRRRSGSATA